MITKVSIDNFKSLVDFEFRPGPVQLILGDNGSGKTTFFECLWRLREVVANGIEVGWIFPNRTLYRWGDRKVQTFEMTVEGNGGRYVYRLEIDHYPSSQVPDVRLETLHFDDRPLFSFVRGEVQLHRDDFSEGPRESWSPYHSGLSRVPSADDNTKLSWFRSWMKDSLCIFIVDPEMEPRSRSRDPEPSLRLSDPAWWDRLLGPENSGPYSTLAKALRDGVIDGFAGMSMTDGSVDSHGIQFDLEVDGGKSIARFREWELSRGQMTLIKLYAIALCVMRPGSTVILDDPVLHVALAEIQPWLVTLVDRSDDIDSQVILSSHHPELINYLAREKGVVFFREHNGPTRVKPAQFHDETGLDPAELIARGWVDG
jgi:energy-coupling factor transporter ATP-binding protein EcfA2